jgi:hypothetical protein
MAHPKSPGEVPADSASLNRLFSLAGSSFVVFYALLLVIHSAALFLRIAPNDTTMSLAVAGSLAYYAVIGRGIYRLRPARLGLVLAGMIGIAALAFWLAGYFIDLSWDGRDYHQKAIRQLVDGLNPIYAELQPLDVYDNVWLNHYPKGAWIAAAAVTGFSGNIEAGKLFNLLMIAAVFLIAFAYLLPKTKLRPWQAGLLALFLAANPVSVYQSLSYYVDGQVSSLFILLVLLLLLCLQSANAAHLLTLAAVIIVALNVKFTGTAYTLLLLAIFILASWWMKKKIPPLYRIWLVLGMAALLGIFFVGYEPYVTNTLNYRHPFYPLYGSSDFNMEFILDNQMPPNFETISRVERLARSIFSRSQNIVGRPSGYLKFPLAVRISEITTFTGPDVRVGGWGPLFGAIVILAAVCLLGLFFISRRYALVALGMVAIILAISLLNSEAWWARYTPQLWLIPVIVLGALWLAEDKRAWLAGNLLALLMFVNIFLVSGAYAGWNTLSTRQVRTTLAELQQSGEKVMLYYGPLEAASMRLQEYGIPYQWVERREDLPCPIELEIKVFYSPMDCPPP